MSLLERAAASAQVLVADLERPELGDQERHHLARVLRLRDGETVIACDGRGGWRSCAWRAAGRGGELTPAGDAHREPAPEPRLAVWLPPLKGDRAEWAVAKLTELGVDDIGLLLAERAAVRRDEEGCAATLARWRRVVREAACQSRRTWLPEVAGPSELAPLVTLGAVRCDLAATEPVPEECATLLVGPEGGWAPAEQGGGPAASLAEFVLRTETAAVVAGATLCARRRSRHAAAVEPQ